MLQSSTNIDPESTTIAGMEHDTAIFRVFGDSGCVPQGWLQLIDYLSIYRYCINVLRVYYHYYDCMIVLS